MKHISSLIICLLLIFNFHGVTASENYSNDNDELVISFQSLQLEYNPLHTYTSTEAQIYTALYEGLVSYNPFTLEPIPATAEYWKISEDEKTYHFYIRENAKFWNGDPVTADTFRNSWLKLLSPDENAEYSFLFDMIKGAREFRLGNEKDPASIGIKAVSSSELEVTLKDPAAHFLKILCHHSFSAIHPDFLNTADWNSSPSIISNGPFYITEKSNEEIIMVKNELYWDRDNVKLDSIKILFTDDDEKVTDDFNNGNIHWAAGGINFDRLNNADSIMVNAMFATSYFFFSCRDYPFDNPDVRRGLSLIIPWEDIRTENNLFIPTSNLVPGISSYPEVTGISAQNLNEGLSLLKKAGYENGINLPLMKINIPTGIENQRIADIIKNAWEEILEVEVLIESYSFRNYYEVLKDDNYTLGTISWIGDFADPLTFLQMWTSDSNLNDAEYRNSEYDTIINNALKQPAPDRYKTMAKAEDIILNTAVVLPISHSPAINCVNNNIIEGWFPNPLDIHPFKYIKFYLPELPPGIVMR